MGSTDRAHICETTFKAKNWDIEFDITDLNSRLDSFYSYFVDDVDRFKLSKMTMRPSGVRTNTTCPRSIAPSQLVIEATQEEGNTRYGRRKTFPKKFCSFLSRKQK